jgi:uncharacterized protein YcfL
MKKLSLLLLAVLACGLTVCGLTGCAANDTNTLTATGTVVVEGDSPTKMVAPDNGQITVYDVSDDKTIWTGLIKKGQTLELNPMNKQLTLDGLACNRDDLKSGHQLRISFDKTN